MTHAEDLCSLHYLLRDDVIAFLLVTIQPCVQYQVFLQGWEKLSSVTANGTLESFLERHIMQTLRLSRKNKGCK